MFQSKLPLDDDDICFGGMGHQQMALNLLSSCDYFQRFSLPLQTYDTAQVRLYPVQNLSLALLNEVIQERYNHYIRACLKNGQHLNFCL